SASAARDIRRMRANAPTRPAATAIDPDRKTELAGRFIMSNEPHRLPIDLGQAIRRQDLTGQAEAAMLLRYAQHVRGKADDDAEVVRDEQRRDAVLGLEAAHRLVEVLLSRVVYARGGLIEEE